MSFRWNKKKYRHPSIHWFRKWHEKKKNCWCVSYFYNESIYL